MRILLLFLSVLLFSQIQVFADEAKDQEKVIKVLQKTGDIKNLQDVFKKNSSSPDLLNAEVARYLAVKKDHEFRNAYWFMNYPYEDENKETRALATLNFAYTKCMQSAAGNAFDCKNPAKKSGLKDLKTKYKWYTNDDVFKIIEIPKVDGKNGTFTTADGKTYSAKTGKIISYASTTSQQKINQRIDELKVQDSEKKPLTEKLVQKEKASDSADDSELKCEWANVFPRKILHGPGCKSGGEKICTGYMACSWKNRKVNRLATCSERYCTDSTATECANQPGYGSKSAEGVNDQYQSDSQSTESNKVKSNQ